MSDERTRPATPRRLERARREGDVARSDVLTRFAVFAGVVLVIAGTLTSMVDTLRGAARASVANAFGAQSWRDGLELLVAAMQELSVPIFVSACSAAVVMGLLQTGPIFATRRVAPDGSRLGPYVRVRERIADGATSVLLLIAVLLGFASLGWDTLHAVVRLRTMAELADVLRDAGAAHLTVFGAILLIVGLVDLGWRRRLRERRLRMTAQEQRQEAAEQGANPQVRARMRAGD